MNNVDSVGHEFDVLEQIYKKESHVCQRELSKKVGISLGMTNVILKRLVQKGLLKVKKINNRNIQYIISPQGLETIARRSFRFFKRTIGHAVHYKQILDELILNIKKQGYTEIVIMGKSDIEFIIEYACLRHKISLLKEIPSTSAGYFRLFSEEYKSSPARKENQDEKTGDVYLRDILIGI